MCRKAYASSRQRWVTWFVTLVAAPWLASIAAIPARAQLTPGFDFNADASFDTDADDRWEELIGTTGFDFELDTANGVSRNAGLGTAAISGITAAYEFPGGSTENVAGALLSDAGTSTARSFQSGPGDWTNEDVSIEVWFRPDDLTPTPGNGQIIFEDGGGTGFGFFVDNNELRLRKAPGGGNVAYNLSTDPFGLLAGAATDEFIQAVGTYDTSAGTMELFINGTSVGPADNPGGGDWSGGDAAGVGTRGGANTGGIGGGQSSTESFDGEIGLFRVYRNQILTPTEVQNNYDFYAGAASTLYSDTDGDWSTATNWDPDSMPDGGSDAFLGNGNTITVSGAVAGAKSLTVGHAEATLPGAGTLSVTGGTLLVPDLLLGDGNDGTIDQSGGTLIVNDLAGGSSAGTINLDGGTLSANTITDGAGTTTINLEGGTLATPSTDITVDDFNINSADGGGTVTYTRDGGTLTVNNILRLGGESSGDGNHKGDVTQSGGIINVGGDLLFGGVAAGDNEGGTYNLDGGTLNVSGNVIEGDSGSPNSSIDSAQLHIDGGALNVSGDITVQRFAVGNDGGQTGTYDITGGQNVESTGTTAVGSSGTGTLTLTDGTWTAANSVIGESAPGVGTVNVNGGTATLNGTLTVGSNGKADLSLSGGTGHTFKDITIGAADHNNSDGTVTINMPNESDLITANTVIVGNNGKGTFNLTKGTFTANVGIHLAETANAVGARTASMVIGSAGTSPTLNVDGGNFETAYVGAGTVTMDSGTFNQLANNIIVGQKPGSDATFTLNGGLIDVDNQLRVANEGTGLFVQNGGTVNVGTILDLGNTDGGDGTYTMNGGILNAGDRVNSDLIIGNVNSVNTTAKMEIIDGTVNVGKSIRIADNGGNSSGTLIVGDGTTSPVVNLNTGIGSSGNNDGNFETAAAGSGTFTLKSGTVVVNDNNLITGQAVGSEATVTVGGFAAPALLDVTGGDGNRDWNTNGGHGIVSVLAGGTIDVGRDINMGSDADANSGLELTVDGGTVNVGAAQSGGGDVNFRAGGPKDNITVQAGTLNTNGGNVVFADATDVVELTGTGKLDMGGGTIVVTEADGSQFDFNGGLLQNLGLFSGPSGATLTTPDVSGTGTPQDGTLASAEPAGEMTFANLQNGMFGGAIDLDGDNDYLDFGTATALGNNAKIDQFSLSMWFNRDVNDTGGANDTNHAVNNVLVGHSRTAGNDHFELGSEDADLEGYVDMDGGTDFTGPVSFAQGVVDDTWHHVAVTFDASRTSDEVHYFLDGQLVTKDVGDDPDGLAASVAELTLGIARIDGSEKWGDLDGLLDDFSLWSRPLTDTEVARLYNGGDGATLQSLLDDGGDPFDPAGLDIYAPMDELSGTAGPAVTLVQDGGTLAPGASTGISGIGGDYDMNAGTLEIELAGSGGIAGVDFDFVDVLGDADLDGFLEVALLGGFMPEYEETFNVLHANQVTLGPNFMVTQPGGLSPAELFRAAVISDGGTGQFLQLTFAVPEPAAAALAALAGLAFLATFRFRRRPRR